MKRIICFLLASLVLSLAQGQSITLQYVADLPSTVNEASGLQVTNSNSFWLNNDSGSPNAIYECDVSGNLVRTLTIMGANHVDWEAVTQDNIGYFYIGDFGNNGNARNNQKIYKIIHPDSVLTGGTAAQAINFSYPDQTSFPPVVAQRNFDMEAMVWHNDSIYMFSKNRTSPFNGVVKMYSLPDIPGTYVANLKTSFVAGSGVMDENWITDAALSPDGMQLVLMSYSKLWLFDCVEPGKYFDGIKTTLTMTNPKVKFEGVSFAPNGDLYIAHESGAGFSGKLYKVDISSHKKSQNIDLGMDACLKNGAHRLLKPTGLAGSSYTWNTKHNQSYQLATGLGTYSVEVVRGSCIARDTIQFSCPDQLAPQLQVREDRQ